MSAPKSLIRALVTIALVFFLVSCDNARSDLFNHTRHENLPGWVGVYPDPSLGPFDIPPKVQVTQPDGFLDWKAFYSLDAAGTPDLALKWTPYDPVTGIYVIKSGPLRVCLYDEDGLASQIYSWSYLIEGGPPPAVYIAAGGGTGGNGFDPDYPLGSIQAGIDLAADAILQYGGTMEVHVRSGDYHESPVMAPGVRLIGSYDVAFTTGGGYPPQSRIYAANAANTMGSNPPYDSLPGYGLRVPAVAGSTEESYIESFEIRAPAAANVGAAVVVEGQNARFQDCRFIGNGMVMQAGFWVRSGGSASVYGSFATGNDVPGLGRTTAGAVVINGSFLSVDSVYNAGFLQGGLGLGLTYIGIYGAQTGGAASVSVNSGSITNTGGVDAKLNCGIAMLGGTLSVMGCPNVNSQSATFGPDTLSCGILLDEGPLGAATSATIESNQDIHGSEAGIFVGNISAGICIADRVNAVIRGNASISGGTGNLSAGLVFRGSGGSLALHDNGLVRGGEAPAQDSLGIFLSVQGTLAGPITVARNRVWGGSGNNSVGVNVEFDAAPGRPIVIRDNAIHGGTGWTGAGTATGGSVAASPAQTAYFLNNDIFSGTGSSTYGAYVQYFVRPVYINNIIHGQSIGLYVVEAAQAMPREIRNNSLSDPSGTRCVILENSYTPYIPSLGDFNVMAGCSGNAYLDPFLASAFQSAGLPADPTMFAAYNFTLNGGTDTFYLAGGMDCSGYFADSTLNGNFADLYGYGPPDEQIRDTPWSVGAAEYRP